MLTSTVNIKSKWLLILRMFLEHLWWNISLIIQCYELFQECYMNNWLMWSDYIDLNNVDKKRNSDCLCRLILLQI